MIFLALHIAFMSSFGLQIKYHQASGRDLLSVGAINYFSAALAAGIWVVHKGELWVGRKLRAKYFNGSITDDSDRLEKMRSNSYSTPK